LSRAPSVSSSGLGLVADDRQTKEKSALGSTVDDWLAEERVLDEFRAIAIKEVITWQQEMKKNLSKNEMAILATIRRPRGAQTQAGRRRPRK
jgi:hypothetical protein